MDHDFFTLFSRFWWLIFPLFWMGAMVMAHWSRHARANRALDIVKSYANQGKDPPPELLKSLQADGNCGWRGDWRGDWQGGWRYSPQRLLHRTFVFTALAIAFGILMFRDGHGFDQHGGLLIPFAIFVALAISSGLSLLFGRSLPPYDRNGPPQ